MIKWLYFFFVGHLHSSNVQDPQDGAQPAFTGDAIISIPEGGGHTSQKTGRGIISMPGAERHEGVKFTSEGRHQQKAMRAKGTTSKRER